MARDDADRGRRQTIGRDVIPANVRDVIPANVRDGILAVVRDVVLAILVLALLAAPLWVTFLHLDDPTYRYERLAVTADEGTIEFEDPNGDASTVAVSGDILCTEAVRSRACPLERQLLDGERVPTEIFTSTPDTVPDPFEVRYRFVKAKDGIYEPATVLNRSQAYRIDESDGSVVPVEDEEAVDDRIYYRVELTLEPIAASRALDLDAVTVGSVDPVVREAADTGSATAHERVDVPDSPIELADGTYYRVYLAETRQPTASEVQTASVIRWFGPLVGLVLAVRLAGRFEVRYVGTRREE